MAALIVKTAQQKHVIWQSYNALSEGRLRNRDLRSAECAGLANRTLCNSPLQCVTGVWTWVKKRGASGASLDKSWSFYYKLLAPEDCTLQCTVKPAQCDHPLMQTKAVFVDMWSLFAGFIHWSSATFKTEEVIGTKNITSMISNVHVKKVEWVLFFCLCTSWLTAELFR